MATERANLLCAMHVFALANKFEFLETALLGPVTVGFAKGVRGVVGLIPDDLANEARQAGFEIVSADWRRDIYKMKVLPAPGGDDVAA